MVGREISATEIGKHSKLIKSAQEDMAAMDVLVCGRCLTVCHFIEDFEQHKKQACSKENNNVRECKDTKPKIWAFLLWKATQVQNIKNNNNGKTNAPNSWLLYQTWVKMDESVRDTWIMAGRTIQSFSKVSQGGLQEMPVKITKTVVNNNAAAAAGGAGAANDSGSGALRKAPLTFSKPQATNFKTPAGKLTAVKSKTPDNEAKISTSPSSQTVGGTANTPTNILSKIANKKTLPITASAASSSSTAFTTPSAAVQGKVNTVNLPTAKTATPLSRRATRSSPNSDDLVQENVEKIVAKRFNPRRKMHEYLVKWDGRPHDQNTWEPLSHLEHVQHFLDIFEKQLARQKENRAALQAKQGQEGSASATAKALEAKKADAMKSGGLTAASVAAAAVAANKSKGSAFFKNAAASAEVTVGNVAVGTAAASSTTATTAHNESKQADNVSPLSRPTRTSKTKAMDQVKQWVSGGLPIGTGIDSGDNAVDNGQNSMNSSGGSTGSAGGGGGSRTGGLKRKFHDSVEDIFDAFTSADTPSATASTMEDLEEDLIPSHTVKRMKNGTGVSVESNVIRMNGTNSRSNLTSFSGEALPVGPKSAEVILTKEKGVSGIVRRPGFTGGIKAIQKSEAQVRILSKEESTLMSTGIVRNGTKANVGTAQSNQSSEPSSNLVTSRQTFMQRLGAGGRQTPTFASSTTSTNSSSMHTQQIVQRTGSGTIIQRRTLPAASQQRTGQMGGGASLRSNLQSSTPTGGRMIVPRTVGGGAQGMSSIRNTANKVVTPEQKILQLSRSGDLKVTKKMMTREDAVAQRLGTQRQQQIQRQQQQQHQSQVQIQKVQQIAPPHSNTQRSGGVSIGVRKRPDGKVLGGQLQQEEPQPQISSQQLQAQMLTAAAAAAEQQQQQEQLELQQQEAAEQTLLLTSDQLLTNEDGTPLLVTGEDGTVYQVAGKNAEGQTILVTQGPDGEQQFAFVATAESDDNQQVLTLANVVAEAVAQMPGEQQQQQQQEQQSTGEAATGGGNQYLVKATQEDGTTHMVAMTEAELQQHQVVMQQQLVGEAAITEAGGDGTSTTTSTTNSVAVAGTTSAAGAGLNQICIQTGDGADGSETNIPAEVVQAELPSPGGTRRVVLLLQDGTFMMTEMQDEEFKALNISA